MKPQKLHIVEDQEISMPTDWLSTESEASYRLDTYGKTLSELIENATISEVYEDGTEQASYGFYDAPDSVQVKAKKMLKELLRGDDEEA